MPNDVFLLEPVLSSISNPTSQWQTTYILILWLSLICLAPFDLTTIESASSGEKLVTRLLDLAKAGLASAGKDRDACAILCARVLSRQDVWSQELAPFMDWGVSVFSDSSEKVLLVLKPYDLLMKENWSSIGNSEYSWSF